MTNRLNRWRKEIDRIDQALLRLLNRRAAAVLQIGRVKKGKGLPVFDGRREERVLRRLFRANYGPLPASSIRQIFRRILKESRSLQTGGHER